MSALAPLLRRATAHTGLVMVRAARWSRPHAKRTMTAATVALRGACRTGWHHRAVGFGLFLRFLWWSALALLMVAGRNLVAFDRVLDLETTTWIFGAGLLCCAVVLMAARPRYLRFAAWSLGTVHGAGLMLTQALAG